MEATSVGLGLGTPGRNPMTGCGAQSLGFRERAVGSQRLQHRPPKPKPPGPGRGPRLLRLRLLGAESEAEAAQSRAPRLMHTADCGYWGRPISFAPRCARLDRRVPARPRGAAVAHRGMQRSLTETAHASLDCTGRGTLQDIRRHPWAAARLAPSVWELRSQSKSFYGKSLLNLMLLPESKVPLLRHAGAPTTRKIPACRVNVRKALGTFEALDFGAGSAPFVPESFADQ